GFTETHLLAFDVALQRGKLLMALRALVRGLKLEPNNPELRLRAVLLYKKAEEQATLSTPAVSPAADMTQPPLSPSPTPAAAGAAPAAAANPPTTMASSLVARVLAEEAESVLGSNGGIVQAVEALRSLAIDARWGSLGARVAAAKAMMVANPSAESTAGAADIVMGGMVGAGA
ncbi:unnamed protein product, partial [Discosporangium mesarthrocarpum]